MVHDILIGVIAGITIAAIVILPTVDSDYREVNEIIEHGCGQYNPTTREFEWKVKK